MGLAALLAHDPQLPKRYLIHRLRYGLVHPDGRGLVYSVEICHTYLIMLLLVVQAFWPSCLVLTYRAEQAKIPTPACALAYTAA